MICTVGIYRPSQPCQGKHHFLNVTNYTNHNITYDQAYVSAVLAHEIAHTLNLGEVYADQYGDCANHASGEGMQCVMEPVQFNDINTNS